MKEEDKKEMWKNIGYLQGYYQGQLDEVRKQIAYEKLSEEEKLHHNTKEFFNAFGKYL